MLTLTKDKINQQTQSLNYILLNLAKLRKDYVALQAKYSFSTDTHFLLLKPARLFKEELFIQTIGKIILDFYKLFPDEGIVLTEKDEAGTLANGESILKEDGFHLPVDLMVFIVEAQKPKIIEVIKEIPVEVVREVEVIKEVPIEIVREVEVVKGIDFELLQEMMKDVPNITIKKQA
ncbi:MAG: hypothetical protein AB8G86_25305 [Saprospiraceae bacterium]